MQKILYALMALLILSGSLGFAVKPAQAADVPNCTEYHVVKRGEYLVQIARLYDTHWRTLAEINNLKHPSLIFPGQTLCVAVKSGTGSPADGGTNDQDHSGIPTFSITGVVAGKTVTIRTNNFPANRNFDVLMGRMGTRGINGTRVATLNSGRGGAFTATFDIPAALADNGRIAIRLQANDGSGYFAYNWFYNNTTGSGTGSPVDDNSSTPGHTGIPTFSISSVVRDSTVTVLTKNFPANKRFNVLMNVMGTRGENGITVATIDSGKGGAFTATFNIPAALQGDDRIAIRMESTTGGFFAYNWFWNNTTP